MYARSRYPEFDFFFVKLPMRAALHELEIGRRRIRDRIRALEKQVEQLSKQRDVRRRRRRQQGIPVLSIIGYTNAGKSTLLNALTNSDIEAADKLFMTLDPTSRRLRFPREGEVVITDTVGFIADLPKDLVAAFRATLEELADANLLLHVIDAADPQVDEKIGTVEGLLRELDLSHLPILRVLNKTDLLPDDHVAHANTHTGRLGRASATAYDPRCLTSLRDGRPSQAVSSAGRS